MSTSAPSPTPFHSLLEQYRYLPDECDPVIVFQRPEKVAMREELIRRALAFFAAGGYEEYKSAANVLDDIGYDTSKDKHLLRILDGEDGGTGERE